MKKSYEKPDLMFLSLSPNTQLCGSCDVNLMKDQDLANYLMKKFHFGNNDEFVTPDDFTGTFGPGESCDKVIDSYCKFTSSGTMVAWS